DFTFDDAIFLASYIIDERADFLGREQHVAASDGAVQGRLDREWPHRGVKYHDRLSFCRGRYRTRAGDCCQFCSTQSGSHRNCRPAAVARAAVLWLAIIFASFGYRAPRNTIVTASLCLAALLISASRPCFTCRLTRPTSIQLSWPSAN